MIINTHYWPLTPNTKGSFTVELVHYGLLDTVKIECY